MKYFIFLYIFILYLSIQSCKEYEKRKILAQEEAISEINREKALASLAYYDRELKRLNKEDKNKTKEDEAQAEMEGETTSRGQSRIMNNDTTFIFSNNNNIGFKYKIISSKKLKLTFDKSVVNGKYLLYKEGKKMGANGVINYKIRLDDRKKILYVEGAFVKKK